MAAPSLLKPEGLPSTQLHGEEMAQDLIKSAAFMEEHALALPPPSSSPALQ